MNNCPNCNAELKAGVKHCDNCGTKIVSKKNSHSVKKPFSIKGVLAIIIPAVAVIAAAAIIVSLISSPSTNSDYFGYFRDNQLFISDFSEGYGEQASENFKKENTIFGNYRDFIRLSNDGKKLFYVDNYDGASYKLYCKNTNDMDAKPVKISSDIIIYDISDDGDVVTYIKDKGNLYQHNLQMQSDLIDENVVNYLVTDNGQTILYQKNSEGEQPYQFDLYISKSGGKGKKLVTNVDSFSYVSQDLSTVYYVSGDSLYKLTVGKSSKKLVDNVRDVIKVYDTGEIFFTKTNENGSASLYYFDGSKTSKSLVDNYYRTESVATGKPVIVVCSNNEKISYSVIIKDKTFDIEQEIVSIGLNSAGTEIHFTADFDTNTQLTTLYSAKIDNSLKDVKKITGEVFQGKYISGEKYVYVKDYDTSTMTGTVYFDNKVVGKNIYYSSLTYCSQDNVLLYFDKVVDFNARLNKFAKGKGSVVRDSVLMNSLSVSNDSKAIFLADCYNDDGILYVFENGKLIKIDHDVSSTFTIISNEDYDLKAHTNF